MRSGFYALAGTGAVAATRLLFRSRLLYDLDSVNFALGMRRFDPAAHQPHPPGYFLYVCLARLVNHFLSDPNTALVAISVAASCGAAWMIYLLTKEWFGEGPARASMALFLFSPLCWFHGTVALTYIVEAFFSALTGYLCWRVYSGRIDSKNAAWSIWASAVFALAAGFRPSTALLLAPLWLISLWRVRGNRRWLAILTAAAVTLLWFVPMAQAAGGIRHYLAALGHLWWSVPARRTTLASPWLAVARILTIGWIFVLCFGSASAFLFQPCPDPSPQRAERTRFLWAWLTPGLLFFGLVFLNFVNSGYLLVLCPPGFAYLAARVHGFISAPERRRLRWAAVIGAVGFNCVFFVFAPLYCSYQSVRTFERQMETSSQIFRNRANPRTTLLIGFDSHFLGYRHAGYYLPEFVTAQYPEVNYADGKRVFVMHGLDTQVLRAFPVDGFERFLLFPLPEGEQYTAYLDNVLSKLPQGTVSTISIGGRNILTGPASAIPMLFPATASDSSRAFVEQ